ncbi:MAG: SGNH/GDSL hydrolase family protein [Oscillospiraceae bacterium]|jgi:lysophospholipase L1-like esterase|nr:SGNH/GDSL hydrolase family protein [Oscillospiraceae bacterium]
MYPLLSKTVLFQGDSITDCNRDRSNTDSLGDGYVKRIADVYHTLFPGSGTVFLNRGVSGDRARNLLERYETDLLALKPDVLSVLIGINDVWRRYDNGDPTSCEDFSRSYRLLLTQVKRDLPRTKIILLEPFVLYALPDRRAWREDLDPKIQAVRELANEFADVYIPLDGLLASDVAKGVPTESLASDGVHPTDLGHAMLAGYWLKYGCGI